MMGNAEETEGFGAAFAGGLVVVKSFTQFILEEIRERKAGLKEPAGPWSPRPCIHLHEESLKSPTQTPLAQSQAAKPEMSRTAYNRAQATAGEARAQPLH